MAFEYKRNRNKVTSETTSPKFTYTRDLEKRKAYQAQKSALEEQQKEQERYRKANGLRDFVLKDRKNKMLPVAENTVANAKYPMLPHVKTESPITKPPANYKGAAVGGITHKMREEENARISELLSEIEKEKAGYTNDISPFVEPAVPNVEIKTEALPDDIEAKYGSKYNPNTVPVTQYINDVKQGNVKGSDITESILNAQLTPEKDFSFWEGAKYLLNYNEDKYNTAHMSKKERDLYFQIMMSEGVEAADSYYEELLPHLKNRRASEQESITEDVVKDANGWEKAVLTGGEVASTLISPFNYPLTVYETLSGNELGVNNLGLDTATQTIASEIGKDSGFMSWLYQTGVSGLKSAMALAATGGNPEATQIIMGADAATDAIKEGQKRGLTPWQSVIYGTAIGMIEGVTERIGIDAFFSGGKNILGAIFKNLSAEGTEEVVAEFFGNIADIIVNTDDAKLVKNYDNYIANGYTESEAFKSVVNDFALDLALAFAGGALIGSGFGGASAGINAYQQHSAEAKLDAQEGDALLKGETADEDIQTLVDNAKGKDKALEKAAKKVTSSKVDFGELGLRYDASARDVGKLARLSKEELTKSMFEAASAEGVKSQTIGKLTESGLKKREAERVFNLIARDASQERVSTELGDLMRNNKSIRPIYEEISNYLSEEAVTKRVADKVKASPVTEISDRMTVQRLENAGIDVVDESGDIDNIDSVVNVDEFGNYVLKRESGEAVTYAPSSDNLPNVDAANADKVSFAVGYGLNGAQTYVKLAPDNAGVEYKSAFNDIYNQGNTNKAFTQIETDIPLEVQKAIYEAGKADFEAAKQRKIDAEKKAEAAEKAAKEKEASFVKKEMGFKSDRVTVSDAALEKLKAAKKDGKGEQYKAAVKVIDGLAKMLQVNINIVASETDANGNYISENGMYNRATNTFTFDIMSGMDNVADISYSAMIKTAGHELTHFIQNWSPSKYLTLKNTTLKFLTEERGEQWINEQLKDIQRNNKAIGNNLTLEQAKDELVADAFEDVLSNIDFAETILRTDKTLFDKIHSWVKKHANDFKKNLGIALKDVKAQTEAGLAMKKASDRAQALYNEWADAFSTALENSTVQQSEVPTDADGYVQLQQLHARAREKILDTFGIKSVNQYVGVQKSVIDTLEKSGFFENGNNIVTNTKSGMVIEITKSGIRETLGPGMRFEKLPRNLKILKLSTIEQLPELIKQAELVQDDAPNTHKGLSRLRFAYFLSDATIKGTNLDGEYDVTITAKKSPQKNKFWIHEIRTTKKEQRLSSSEDINPEQEYNKAVVLEDTIPQESSSVKENISDTQNSARRITKEQDTAYMDAVNRGDTKTAQRMVEEAAKKAGYAVKAYHGTDFDFNVYSYETIGQATGVGILGEGFYFTDKKGLAKVYGKNIKASYLSLENPYTATNDDLYKINTDKLANEGYDCVVFDAPKGRIINIFDNTKVKSADLVTYDDNGNVIPLSERFNPENEDIRYSARNISRTKDVRLKKAKATIARDFVESMPNSPQKAKLKVLANNYAKQIKAYEKEQRIYIEATASGNEEIATVAYAGMTLAEVAIDQIETDVDFASMINENATREKLREAYTREGELEEEIRAFESDLTAAEREVRESKRLAEQFAEREKQAKYRAKQIELRNQRDRNTSMLLKEKTRLKSALDKPSENASVPKDAKRLAEQVINLVDALNAFNGTAALTRPSAELIDRIMKMSDDAEKLANGSKSKSLAQRVNSVDTMMRNARLSAEQVKTALSELEKQYRKLAPDYERADGEKRPSAAASIIYDKSLHEGLRVLAEYFGEPNIVLESGMYFAKEGLKIVRAMNHQILKANETYIKGKNVDVLKLRDRLYKDALVTSPFLNRVLGSKFVSNILMPKTMIHIALGATENADTLYDMFDEGQMRYIRFMNGARELFMPIEKELSGEKFKTNKADLKTGLKYTDGTEVLLNYDMAMSLIKIVDDADNLRHAVWGGLHIPDLKPYNKGDKAVAYNSKRIVEHAQPESAPEAMSDEEIATKLQDAASKGTELTNEDYLDMYAQQIAWSNRLNLATEIEAKYKAAAQMLKEQMSKTEVGKQALKALSIISDYYDNYARKHLDEATMEMYGFEKTLQEGKHYYPIRIRKDEKYKNDNEFIVRDYSLENWGNMKHRVNSKKGIELFGAVTELESYMESTAKYYGWTNVIKNMHKILDTQIIDDKGNNTTLIGAVNKLHGSYEKGKFFKNFSHSGFERYMQDLENAIVGVNKSDDKWLSIFHGAFVTNALVLNFSTPLVQYSALPLVAADSGLGSFLKSTAKKPPILSEARLKYIAKYSEVYRYRASGLINADVAAARQNRSKMVRVLSSKAFAWTETADAQVLGHQFYALLENVKRTHKGISEERAAQIAGKQLDQTIYDFQANYTVLQRAPVLQGSGLKKMIFGTFRTQQITMFNAYLDSAVRSNTLKAKLKTLKEGTVEYNQTKAKYNESRLRTTKINLAILASNVLNSFIRMGVVFLRHKDDEDERWQNFAWDLLDSYTSMFTVVGEIVGWVIKHYHGENYYNDDAISFGAFDIFNDALQSFADLTDGEEASAKENVKDLMNVLALFGVPARNAYNLLKALLGWVEKLFDETGVDFDFNLDEW